MTNLFKTLLVALVFAGVALIAPSTAKAGIVTFETQTGSFFTSASATSGNNTNAITFTGIGGTLTLTFAGVVPGTTVFANPTTFASFGTITTSITGVGALIGPLPTTLTLQINQSVPSVGNGTVSGSLTGFIAQNASTGVITFSVTQVVIGGVTYSVVNNPLALVPPSTNNGVTSIQGQITTVPEPASLLLLGTGLIGAAGAVRRKLKGSKQE
jgi:hypothetical protein